MFSFPASAEWKTVVPGEYVNIDSIKKHNGYTYFWKISDFKKKEDGFMSFKTFYKADCVIKKYQNLSITTYKQPMGLGQYTHIFNYDEDEWRYAPPGSSLSLILDTVCKY